MRKSLPKPPPYRPAPLDRNNAALVAHIALEVTWDLRDEGLDEEAHLLTRAAHTLQEKHGVLPLEVEIPPGLHQQLKAEIRERMVRAAREERLLAATGDTIH